MAKYKIEISSTAERQLRKLPGDEQKRVARAMLELADNPYPRGSRKLTGYVDAFRIRVGRYRILYSVSEETLIVIVFKIGHRKDVYR
jgi:mRNA interferase RelE/StbE